MGWSNGRTSALPSRKTRRIRSCFPMLVAIIGDLSCFETMLRRNRG